MEKISFREAQLGAREILRFIDKICKQQGFSYFLMYGSLLGAIRDKGIIPWDDDIDVIMPRPDYDKFIRYCEKNECELRPFKLFENSLNPKYPHPIARMSDMRYKVDFDNEKDYGIGLFVDIYPLDGVGNNLQEAITLTRKSKRIASLCFLTSRKKFGVDNTASRFKMLIKFPAYIWANLLGNRYYINKSKRYCTSHTYECSKYVACVAQPEGGKKNENKNVFEKVLFEPMEAEFEGDMYRIPTGYDKILTMIYGDYMTPLPERERKLHHTYDTYRIIE